MDESMRVFVINLDRDIDRMAWNKKQAAEHNVLVERVSGIYGRDLPIEEVHESVNRFRWFCAMGRSPLIGEIGCALSHLKIYRKMIEENIPIACILEDDVFLLDGFKRKLAQLNEWSNPNEPVVVLLHYTGVGNGDTASSTNSGVVKVRTGTFACSYVLTLAAAKALIKENFPLVTPSDVWARWDKYGIIQLYVCDTKVCWHNNAASGFISTIAENTPPKNQFRA